MVLYRSSSSYGSSYSPMSRSTSRVLIRRSGSDSGAAGYLSRSGSTVFGRAIGSSSFGYTPPLHSVAVQRPTPHYSDRYPHVRYSYGASPETGLSIISRSNVFGRDHYTQRDVSSRKYLDGRLSMYDSSLKFAPRYGPRPDTRAPIRHSYKSYMNVEDAVDMYKKRCMTSTTLSKYWLTPSTWQSRRNKEWNLGRSAAIGSYNYTSRYSGYY